MSKTFRRTSGLSFQGFRRPAISKYFVGYFGFDVAFSSVSHIRNFISNRVNGLFPRNISGRFAGYLSGYFFGLRESFENFLYVASQKKFLKFRRYSSTGERQIIGVRADYFRNFADRFFVGRRAAFSLEDFGQIRTVEFAFPGERAQGNGRVFHPSGDYSGECFRIHFFSGIVLTKSPICMEPADEFMVAMDDFS